MDTQDDFQFSSNFQPPANRKLCYFQLFFSPCLPPLQVPGGEQERPPRPPLLRQPGEPGTGRHLLQGSEHDVLRDVSQELAQRLPPGWAWGRGAAWGRGGALPAAPGGGHCGGRGCPAEEAEENLGGELPVSERLLQDWQQEASRERDVDLLLTRRTRRGEFPFSFLNNPGSWLHVNVSLGK